MQWMCEAALYTKKEKAFFDVTQGPDHVLFSSHPATQQEQQDRELESGKKERERERGNYTQKSRKRTCVWA